MPVLTHFRSAATHATTYTFLVLSLGFGCIETAPAHADVSAFELGIGLTARGVGADLGSGVWVVDGGTNRALHVRADGSVERTIGSTGTGDGQFDGMSDVAVGSDGAVYIDDFGFQGTSTNTRLQKFDASGLWAWTHVLSPQSTNPGGLAVAGTSIFSADPYASQITTFSALDGMQTGQFAVGNPTTFPSTACVQLDGSLLVGISNSTSSSIVRYTTAGTLLGTFVDVPGYLTPALAVAPDGSVVVAFQQPVEIRRYSATGELLGAWTPSVAGEPAIPQDVAVDSSGVIWVPVNVPRLNGIRLLRIDVRRPAASIAAAPAVVATGEHVTLDASASKAVLSHIIRYDWDLDGDGVFETSTGTTASLVTQFATPGAKPIAVRVTEAGGGTADASASVEVRPASRAGLVGVSINAGAQFTNDPHVKISAKWPHLATGLTISNDRGFASSLSIPVQGSFPWTIARSGAERLPKTIYVRFSGGASGAETYQDAIILDQTAPMVQSSTLDAGSLTSSSYEPPAALAARHARAFGAILQLRATDATSGVESVQLAGRDHKVTRTVPFTRSIRVASPFPAFVRVRDSAGNLSKWHVIARPAAGVSVARAISTAGLRAQLPVRVRCWDACVVTADVQVERSVAPLLNARAVGARAVIGRGRFALRKAGLAQLSLVLDEGARQSIRKLIGRRVWVRVTVSQRGARPKTLVSALVVR